MAKFMCPQCHNEVTLEDKFCMNCGANLEVVGRVEVDKTPNEKGGEEPAAGFRVTMLSMSTNEQDVRELKEGTLTIGREKGDWIIDDPSMSPSHAMLTIKGDKIQVDDLGSLNGIYKKVLEPTMLKGGEYLLAGSTYLRFEAVSAPDEFALQMYMGPQDSYPVATLTILLAGCRDGEVYPVHKLPFEIGRESGDLQRPSDNFLSFKHCRLIRMGSGIGIEDVGSTNGTFIKIQERALLQAGDWLHMGQYLFRIESL